MRNILPGTGLFAGVARIRHLVIAAAMPVLVGTPTWANGGSNAASLTVGKPQVFAFSVPLTDTGSQAYPTTTMLGADGGPPVVNHVARHRVPAYQHGFDVGSQAYPEPR